MNELEYLAYNLAILGQFFWELFEGVVPRGSLRVVFYAIAIGLPALAQFRPRRLDLLQDVLLCTAMSTVVFVLIASFENGPSPFLLIFLLGVFVVCLPFSLVAVLLVRMLRRPHHPAKAGGH